MKPRRIVRHAAPEPAPLLEVDDLRTTFDTPRGTVVAVDGVSLRLEEGQTLGVVGESGSGKTVLARSILQLVSARNATTTGRVRLLGRDLVGLSPKAMRSVWGVQGAIVFQDPMTSLNSTMRIGDQITESLRYHLEMHRGEALQTALALLRSVGIPEPETRIRAYPHQLSGGMRQRVTIAVALACGPKLLVADEPTTALDVTIQRQILDLLATQKRERAMGMVLITHDLGVVAGRTDRVAVMYAGRVVERAPTRVLFHERRHPYTDALLQSIPRLSNAGHTRLQVIPGRPPDLVALPEACAFAARCRHAQPRCVSERPVLTEARLGHEYACFYPIGTDEGHDALARNVAAGHNATGLPVTDDATVDVTTAPGGQPLPTAPEDETPMTSQVPT
ncbi:MAG TPA: ABC transporter ATP-binding protein [Acidimicrobiales bacterium]|nr:ABC transporter ATP-binding protein [Acidimicrobiales bacterium]